MNKLLTYNGGQPIYLDDFRFLDDIYRSGIESTLQAFANNINCILWGCEVSQNETTTNVSEGAVWIDNEIYLFEGGVVDNNEYVYLLIDDYYEGRRLMRDGSQRDVYNIRKVKLEAGPILPPNSYEISNMPNLKDLLDINNGPWQNCEYGQDVVSVRNPLSVRRLSNGLIELRGDFYFNFADVRTQFVVATIPQGFAPSTFVVPTFAINNAYATIIEQIIPLKIYNDGKIVIANTDGLEYNYVIQSTIYS